MSERHLILVVEDNPDNRTLVMDVLDSMDFDVVVAIDGEEGIQMAKDKKPALILMDLSLPKKDGWEATRDIKADPEIKHIPIIALTAHAMVGDKERALEAGCDGYLSKPIDLIDLAKTVHSFLGKP
jgi:CheY-like chemotaxis protein